jgi:hypothetical protein
MMMRAPIAVSNLNSGCVAYFAKTGRCSIDRFEAVRVGRVVGLTKRLTGEKVDRGMTDTLTNQQESMWR